jgi:toxin FitB
LTIAIAKRWGRLSGELGHDGADLMIAATALEHNLVVVTRNVRHFEPAKVNFINPFLSGHTEK